ncbi:hypothetical protein EX30DRAFT_348404 [Ascodesmis nigricans]|uniref:Uncharacterized protein n=1 Tax=Ascodesmis nigricans TaxID=341454 RepID=A0A4S2MYC0_9PEZI|nr:hypothetical protein EX30DRAFT_348404 [Ascodesmis nigricans]
MLSPRITDVKELSAQHYPHDLDESPQTVDFQSMNDALPPYAPKDPLAHNHDDDGRQFESSRAPLKRAGAVRGRFEPINWAPSQSSENKKASRWEWLRRSNTDPSQISETKKTSGLRRWTRYNTDPGQTSGKQKASGLSWWRRLNSNSGKALVKRKSSEGG